MAADRARYDVNLIPSLVAVSNADGTTPVSVWADPTTHALVSTATLGGTAVPAAGLTSAAAVQIVDGSGNQITSFGGGTQYTDAGTPPTHPIGPTLEFNNAGAWVTVGSANPLPVSGTLTTNNAVPAANNIGVLPAVASTAAPSYTNTDQVLLSTDLSGNLRVVTSGGGGGLSVTDEAAFTAGTSQFTPSGGVYNDIVQPLVSGQQGTVRLTADRRLKVDIGTGSTGIQIVNNQQVNGNDIATVADGVQLVAQAGPSGDPLDTTNNALNSFITGGGINILSQALPNDKTFNGSVSQTDAAAIFPINGIGGISFQITGTWSGTLNLEATVDGNNWSSVICTLAGFNNAFTSTITANGLYRMVAPAGFTQVRLRINPYVSGTAYVTYNASAQANTQSVFQGNAASLNVAAVGNVASGVTDSGNPIKVGGIYNASAPTFTNGQRGDLQLDSSGNLKITGSLSIGGTTDGATFTGLTSTFTGIGAVYNDNLINLISGQQGALRLTSDRRLKVDNGSMWGGFTQSNTQQVNGADIATTADGTQLVSLAGPTGDPLDTTGSSLNVQTVNPTTNPVNVLSTNTANQMVVGGLGSGSSSGVQLTLAYPASTAFITVLSNNALSATLGVQVSYDGTNFSPSQSLPLRQTIIGQVGIVGQTTFTTGTTYQVLESLAGVKIIKVWLYSYTSGSAIFQIVASQNSLQPLDSGQAQMADNALGSTSNAYIPLVGNLTYLYDGSSNYVRQREATNDSVSAIGSPGTISLVRNSGGNYDIQRQANAAAATTGTGLTGVGILGIYNSTSPSVTSGNYERIQLDSKANLKNVIYDAAGNARGANVTANNALLVDTTAGGYNPFQIVNNQQIGGNDIATVTDGVQLVAQAGPTGDPISTTGNALDVSVKGTTAAADDSGVIFVSGVPVVPQFATIVASASGNTTIVTGIAGKRIRVLVSTIVANAAVNVQWQTGTTNVTGLYYLAANTGVADAYAPVGHFQTNIGDSLNLNLSGSVAVGGKVTYITV